MSSDDWFPQMPIRCILVDDHTLFRDGVRRLLESEADFTVVAEAGDAGEALEKVRTLRPDLVLMDIGMPGMSSFDAARLMRRQCPETRLVFLSMYEEEEYLPQCLAVGAVGYVLKDAPPSRLVRVLREAHLGRKNISNKLANQFREVPRLPSSRAIGRGPSLTPREREVVRMIAEGNSVREIAGRLGLSAKTVEAHKFNLMRKLNVHNKVQLVTYAIQKKIVKMPAGA
jgi:two-component system response regulator NreC